MVARAATATADHRISLAPIPELDTLAVAYLLDRYVERDAQPYGMAGAVAATLGNRPGLTVSGALGQKTRGKAVMGNGLVDVAHGRIQSRLEIAAQAGCDGDGPAICLDVGSRLEIGDPPALAPLARGNHRGASYEWLAKTVVPIGRRSDFAWAASITGDLHASGEFARPVTARALAIGAGEPGGQGGLVALERSLAIALGKAPGDGELPNGTLDLARGRVAYTTVGDRTVREVAVGVGLDHFTLHIDHELLAVADVDLGWSWLELGGDSAAMSGFRARLAGALAVAGTSRGVAKRDQVGLAFSRELTHTADAGQLATDTRLAINAGSEAARYVIDFGGVLSWVAAPADDGPRYVRYGAQFGSYAKLAHHLELGVQGVAWFEPTELRDLAAPRRWVYESGVVVRWRGATAGAAHRR